MLRKTWWSAWLLGLVGVCLIGCSRGEQPPARQARAPQVENARWDSLWLQAGSVDTVGVAQIAAGDSTSGGEGLTVIETTVRFPAAAAGGEAFAWEAYVRALEPVKLLVFSYDRLQQRFQLVGESRTQVPARLGLNRFILREPIPLRRGYFYGLYMPAGEAIPFQVVHNWKTLITTQALRRPFMDREAFAMYGWRYSVRVFWRPRQEGG